MARLAYYHSGLHNFLKNKVIVIGLDGLEPSLVEAMIGGGELPHLARIRREGFY